MTQFWTYKNQVPLGPGDSIGFKSGKGYYVKHSAGNSGGGTAPQNQGLPTGSGAYSGSNPGGGNTVIAPQNTGLPSGTGTYTPTSPYPVVGQDPWGNPIYGPPPDYVPDTGTTGDSGASQQPQGIDLSGIDIGSLLGLAGLPADVIAKIQEIFSRTTDLNQAIALSLGYIRGTPWYAQTFPGINEGIRNGLIADERGYRAYMNQLNGIYQQYFGRAVSGGEVASALGQGATPDFIGRQFQGDVIAKTNSPDWQYAAAAFTAGPRLTPEELTAAGREQSGIDTPLGQAVSRRLQQATTRLSNVFGNSLAVPALRLGQAGLQAPGLLGGHQAPDIPS